MDISVNSVDIADDLLITLTQETTPLTDEDKHHIQT